MSQPLTGEWALISPHPKSQAYGSGGLMVYGWSTKWTIGSGGLGFRPRRRPPSDPFDPGLPLHSPTGSAETKPAGLVKPRFLVADYLGDRINIAP